ncbi:MBL fold metallo-hydrolase [Irregularibacter muris]|uniref:MBL fold metallo-hydrolase n=1 Tax=Irregularibacter muris TaxID=1796619 RepID=A0AAE3HFG9_9FIRM|nr:MBL fold metallo-hydrolase [Irregularibacter muris]MCR1897623.1 MBL fold metallo-hydrolase [Irregularibacter muris]
MIEEILKNIYVIKIPLPNNPLKNLNSYYIKGEERNLLVDTGFNSEVCYQAMKEGLKKLKVDMNSTDIFLTHIHSDHIGLSYRIASKNSKIYISDIDKKYLDEFLNNHYWNYMLNKFKGSGFSMEEFEQNSKYNPLTAYLPPREIKYETIVDNFTIDLGNYTLRSIITPGHTPGHMCLYEENEKLLFSGDHILFDISPNIGTWNNFENPLGKYIESLEKIKDMNIEHTFSAHRSTIGNHRERIEQLIQHHRKRLEEAYNAVLITPGITAYEVASKMKWSIRSKNWNDFPIVQKFFAVNEAESHLEYLITSGKIKAELVDGKYLYYVV